MTNRLELLPRHRRTVKSILRLYVPGVEVWAYGSRVRGDCYDGSDLDLVLRGPGLAEISYSRLAALRRAFSASTIPIIVEVRDWAAMPSVFHREIESLHMVLVPRTEARTSDRTNCQPAAAKLEERAAGSQP